MADTFARLAGPSQLGTSAATLYTTPANMQTIIREIIVCNTTGSAATVTMSIGTDAAAKRFMSAKSVPANDSYVFDCLIVLAAAEIIQAFAGTTTALTVIMNGVVTI